MALFHFLLQRVLNFKGDSEGFTTEIDVECNETIFPLRSEGRILRNHTKNQTGSRFFLHAKPNAA